MPDVQVIIVLEPDSIGNSTSQAFIQPDRETNYTTPSAPVITNLSNDNCAKAAPVYKRCISLAIATLSQLPNVAIYVDAAHAGWLGWPGVRHLSVSRKTFISPVSIASLEYRPHRNSSC